MRKNKKKGFTLIEIVIVLSILGILTGIAIPRYLGYTETAKEEVCCANCKAIERAYEAYLLMEELEHTNELFNQYLQENGKNICPEGGVLSYLEDEVHCSIHNPVGESGDEEEGPVPFL